MIDESIALRGPIADTFVFHKDNPPFRSRPRLRSRNSSGSPSGCPAAMSGRYPRRDPDSVLQLIARYAVLVRNNVERFTGAEKAERVLQACTPAREYRLPKTTGWVNNDLGNLVRREPDQPHVTIAIELQAPQVRGYDLVEHALTIAYNDQFTRGPDKSRVIGGLGVVEQNLGPICVQ